MIMAIDPGASGGIAYTALDGETAAKAIPMPKTSGDVVDIIRSLSQVAERKCYIEKVGGYVGRPQPGSMMFNFGHGRGVIIGALMMAGWRIIEVTPQRWQAWLNIGKCGGDKNKLKAEAQRRNPCAKVTLKTCDALLILEYAIAQEK